MTRQDRTGGEHRPITPPEINAKNVMTIRTKDETAIPANSNVINGASSQCAMPIPVYHDLYRVGNGGRMTVVAISKDYGGCHDSKDYGGCHDRQMGEAGSGNIRPPQFLSFLPLVLHVSDPPLP